MIENEQVAVIGGVGNMGRLTTSLFKRIGFDPIVSDTRLPESPSAKEAIQSARIVFFSVLPIEEVDRIVAETKDSFGTEYTVLDNASSKRPLKEAFRLLDEKGVSICSTHPLCKHDQPLHGQKVLIMDVGQSPSHAREIAQLLYQSAGMITIPFSFEDHDSTMTILQLVPHLVMRSVGAVLARTGTDIQTLARIASANFQLFNLSLWRTLVQDPKISATIITKLLTESEGQILAHGLEGTITRIISEKDEHALIQLFQQTRDQLDKDGFGSVMNQATITILERLANLQVSSLVIEVTGDRPGLLRQILLPFEQAGINLTAIDSHKNNGKLRFEVGIDEKTIDTNKLAFVVKSLQVSGCTVLPKDQTDSSNSKGGDRHE